MNENSESPSRQDILEQEGSTRAVVSGSYFFVFAILGSILLWFFTIIATGNEGLAYYGAAGVTIGMLSVLANGFNQSFIARLKPIYIEKTPEETIQTAASYTKIYIFIGVLMSLIAFILAIYISDPFLSFILLISIPSILLGYSFGTLGGMLNLKNRFDITAFIGSFFGIVVCIVGGLMIFFQIHPPYFALIYFFITLNTIILSIIYFKKISEFKLRALYFKGKLFSKESFNFLKYSTYSTLTNLESIGLLGNIIVFLTLYFLYLWHPETQLIAAQILTIVMTYAIVKVAIIFFTSPLNIEIAEAVTKKNHQIIQDTITDIGRTTMIIGLTLMTLVCAGSGIILKILHSPLFIKPDGTINQELLISSQITLILCAVGQCFYGFAALFGNALIGAGHAKNSAIAFGLTVLLCLPLTPLFVYFFGYIGAGITMLLTGAFVLPFMLIEVKKKLNVKLNFRVKNLAPVLLIVFLLIFFYPIDAVLEHVRKANNYPMGFIGLAMLIGIILAFFGGLPFFGVLRPGDGKLLRDIFRSYHPFLVKIGEKIIKFGKFCYFANPLHKKISK
ncbi:MAG: hypothetical protein ACTSQP_00015 [Promethearchaeota archaeon]